MRRYLQVFLLAAVGGPVAYLFGERLGGITFLEPTFIVVSWMAPGWLVLMLFFHLLMGRQKGELRFCCFGCRLACLAEGGGRHASRKRSAPVFWPSGSIPARNILSCVSS